MIEMHTLNKAMEVDSIQRNGMRAKEIVSEINKIFLILSVLLLVFCGFTFVSCNKDNGLTKEINKIISKDLLQAMEDMGMPIYRGNNPPVNIEGKYIIAPDVCIATNIPNDGFGPCFRFDDFYPTFSNQNNKKQTITVSASQSSTKGDGYGGYIVGTDDKFTVFVPMDNVKNGHSFKTVDVYSAIAAPNGLKNCYHSAFMISGGGSKWALMENNQGRVIYDADGFSEIISIKTSQKTNGGTIYDTE